MATIEAFGGIVPRVPRHALEVSNATIAHNVKVRNGKIEAWRERLAVDMSVQDAVTLYYKGCCALTWDKCVSIAEYVTDYGRLFITGRIEQPENLILDKDCNMSYLNLGVPAPTKEPTISGNSATGRDAAARSYVYTFVNVFGEESAPSPVSRQITVKDGDQVNVYGFENPPDGYGIVEIHVYRTATAYRDDRQKEQEIITDFLKVAELEVGETILYDTVKDRHLGIVNNTRETRVPPKDLREISYVTGTGVLTGVTDNMVHFSASYQPHNWPSEYDLTLPHNIVHMVTVDTHVMVTTDSTPFVIDGNPGCDPRMCRQVQEGDIALADIGCGYANSAIATPFGMLYSSKDGLVLLKPNATFEIITAPWFSTDDWIKVRPDTVRLAYWRGYIICITDMVSFMLEIDGETYKDYRLGSLTTIDDTPIDMVTTNTGELMMLDASRLIYQWNAGPTLRDYIWESRELPLDGEYSPTSAKVRTEGTLFKLLTPHPDLSYQRYVHDETPFRLGRLGRHYNYRIGFYGTGVVEFVELGMSYLTINRGQ